MRVEWHEAATAAGRHPPPRLIPSRRSVAPISEDRERPRNRFRGRFRFSVRKRECLHTRAMFRDANDFARAFFAHTFPANPFPQHHSANARTSRSARGSPLSRNSATRRASAAPRCSVRAAAGNAWANGLPVDETGNARHRSNGLQRRGFASRPVRAALPWRMPEPGRDVSARRHWLNGRAAAQAAGCRFDSGMSFLWIAHRLSTGSGFQRCGFDSRSKP